MKLIALKRIHRYRTGDVFVVNSTQGRVLKALKKAEDAPAGAGVAPQPDPEREVLQSQAESLGIAVDGRWGNARIKAEIAAAAPSTGPAGPPPEPDRTVPRYGRRDMRAEEE